jgi:plastocyanin
MTANRNLVLLTGLLVFYGPVVVLAKPTTHTVVIENMQFNPMQVRVVVGDWIRWENHDLVPHTVTAENGSFDSRSIEVGRTWKYHVKKRGSVFYKCSFHPTMKASFEVKE